MAEPGPAGGGFVLELDAVATGYTDEPVVRDFSMQVLPGSITTLIGANGAGKSTLLRAIYGLNRHFGGRILLDGQEIQALTPVDRLARGLGFVPQGRCNFPLMSVRENLELGTYSLPRSAMAEAMDRVVGLFPVLRDKWKVQAGNLSGGEQQILEMAMVLQSRPKLLLLDEPSLGLSPLNLQQVFRTVLAIREQGVTVIVVEQNVHGALEISDTAIVLELGRKFLEGPAAEVRHDPRIRAAYLGGTPEGQAGPAPA
ncbi:MAG: ABC transporter ATP-binding protein [Sneathiellaceae bacterium]